MEQFKASPEYARYLEHFKEQNLDPKYLPLLKGRILSPEFLKDHKITLDYLLQLESNKGRLLQEPKDINPRYLVYAKSNNINPYEQNMLDFEVFPGGIGAGFWLWIQQQWRDFCKEEGYDFKFHLCYAKEFDAWLNRKYP